MKKIISILFLTAILLQSLSGLIVLSNFYFKQAYIAKNLCVNRFDAVKQCEGKCYLVKELRQTEQQQEKVPDLKLKEMNLFCQTAVILEAQANAQLILSSVVIPKHNHYSGTYLSSIFHPPKLG